MSWFFGRIELGTHCGSFGSHGVSSKIFIRHGQQNLSPRINFDMILQTDIFCHNEEL